MFDQPHIEIPFVGTRPHRAHEGDAGADLFLNEDVAINPGETVMVGTGTRIPLPYGTVGLVAIRSSVSLMGLGLANHIGAIDAQYRGEIKLALRHYGHDGEPIHLSAGERVAQLLVVPILLPTFIECESLDETARGEGGFGSTGRK